MRFPLGGLLGNASLSGLPNRTPCYLRNVHGDIAFPAENPSLTTAVNEGVSTFGLVII
jgi:hypothetical protein